MGIAKSKYSGCRWSDMVRDLKYDLTKCDNPQEVWKEYLSLHNHIEKGERPKFGKDERAKLKKDARQQTNKEIREKGVIKAYDDGYIPYERVPQALVAMKLIQNLSKREQAKNKPFKWEMHPWQTEILQRLKSTTCDDRSIIFLVDVKGRRGKTKFFGWLASSDPENYQYFTMSKMADVLHLAEPEVSTFVIDVPRDDASKIDYSLLEQLKNGQYSSGKFNGKIILEWDRAINVVVCMNECPDFLKLSIDKYEIYNIEENEKKELVLVRIPFNEVRGFQMRCKDVSKRG